MYPLGTILKVIDGGFGARGANGAIAMIVNPYEVRERITGRTSHIEDSFVIEIIESDGPKHYAAVGEYWYVDLEGKYEVLQSVGQHLYEIFLPEVR